MVGDDGMAHHMREFETGATRNIDYMKPDYEGFMSPLVMLAYGEYMCAHRKQADGSIRNSDNWQLGIPDESYLKSMLRHLKDLWLHHRGFGHLASEPKREALSALLFNVSGMLHEDVKRERSRPAKLTLDELLMEKPPEEPGMYASLDVLKESA